MPNFYTNQLTATTQNPGIVPANPVVASGPINPNAYNPNKGASQNTLNAPNTGTTNEFILPTDLAPYQGLPPNFRDQLMNFAVPGVIEGFQNLPQDIDAYTDNALKTYSEQLKTSLKDLIPQQVGKLADRGILSSSMAENVLSQTYSDAARRSAGKGYETAMKAAEMKTAIPQTLAQLLQYGEYYEDPTVMYGMMERLLRGEMP